MPKTKVEKLPVFLPTWANEPMTFAPDTVLRRAMQVKPPKDWKKALRVTRSKSRF